MRMNLRDLQAQKREAIELLPLPKIVRDVEAQKPLKPPVTLEDWRIYRDWLKTKTLVLQEAVVPFSKYSAERRQMNRARVEVDRLLIKANQQVRLLSESAERKKTEWKRRVLGDTEGDEWDPSIPESILNALKILAEDLLDELGRKPDPDETQLLQDAKDCVGRKMKSDLKCQR